MPTIYALSKNKKIIKKCHLKKFHLKIIIFRAVKKLQYITWACFRNEIKNPKKDKDNENIWSTELLSVKPQTSNKILVTSIRWVCYS